MLSAYKIPKKSVVTSFLKPVLPLLSESLSKFDQANKATYITMELKSQAAEGRHSTGLYKKNLALFDEGSPQEWIDTQRDLMEVWTQNGITAPADRVAVIRAVLRGETLTTCEAALADGQPTDAEGNLAALTMDMVTGAMAEVGATIFPHRALDIQKQWMRKVMKKPLELTTRQTSAALSRINNCLPLFPGATEDSKFLAAELLEILECSLPISWRQKFDYDGYIPSDGTRSLLIQSCKAIEQSQDAQTNEKKEKQSQQPYKKKVKYAKSESKRNSSTIVLNMGKTNPTTLPIVTS